MTPVGELSEHQLKARGRRRKALLCLPVIVGLIAGAVITHVNEISADLSARSRATLNAAGYHGVQVKFSGREANVRGHVARPVDVLAVEALIEGQRGVRWADMREVTIVGALPAAPPPAAAATAPVAPVSREE